MNIDIRKQKETLIESWEAFEKKIEEVNKFVSYQQLSPIDRTYSRISYPLFRGQSNTNWKLTTTLDRSVDHAWQCSAYHENLRIIEKDIASCLSRQWDLEDWSEQNDFLFSYKPQTYEFMTYLRHHEFPSPLLDWTKSPYIAAFFAFKDLTFQRNEFAAIFIYLSDLGYGKASTQGDPCISCLDLPVRSHKRHFLQQCEYTICAQEGKNGLEYGQHEKVFQKNEQKQDILLKLILSYDLQKSFLDRLKTMNISDYVLFNSEESLMHTLAVKYFLKLKFQDQKFIIPEAPISYNSGDMISRL